MWFRAFLSILLIGLAGCADWPEVSTTPAVRQDTDWPRLLPLEDALRAGTLGDADPEASARTLLGRAAALRARAALLRRPVSDDAAFEALREEMRTR